MSRWTEREGEDRVITRYLSALSSALLARPARMIGLAPGPWEGVVTYVKEGLDALGVLGGLEGNEGLAGGQLFEGVKRGGPYSRRGISFRDGSWK